MKPRIPALDGLRAISILLVCCAHFLPQIGIRTRNLGGLGVDVFFVISGYLITTLLLDELDREGTIALRAFYYRRTLRIVPAYVLLLVVAAILVRLGICIVDPRAWPYAITFTYSLVPDLGTASIGQIWSVCVEEHFYLLWPITLLLLGRRHAEKALVATIVLAIPLRVWLYANDLVNIDDFTFTRIDTIAIGCLLALSPARVRGWRWVLIAIVTIVVSERLSSSGVYGLGLRAIVNGLAIAMIVQALSSDANDPLTRALDHPLPVAIGTLSYSLYLGQLLLDPLEPWTFSPWLRLPLLGAYALGSYFLVERPFLRLKAASQAERRDGRCDREGGRERDRAESSVRDE